MFSFHYSLSLILCSPREAVTPHPLFHHLQIVKFKGSRSRISRSSLWTATMKIEICDTCSRIDIESLSSPDGFLHVSKKLASKLCPLCDKLFGHSINKSTDDLPRRIRLSQERSPMGNRHLESQCWIERPECQVHCSYSYTRRWGSCSVSC
jgi:hypothetical protein